MGQRPLLIIWVSNVRMIIRRAVPVYASSLMEVIRCHLGAAGAPPEPASLREVLAARLSDPRKPRGIRHSLGSLVSVLVAGVACGYSGPLAIAGAAAGWDQEVLAAHGTRRNPGPGCMSRRPRPRWAGCRPCWTLMSWRRADGVGWRPAALDPQLAARIAARAAAGKEAGGGKKKRRRKPPAAEALRETRADGWVRAAPGHPGWIRPSPVIPATARPGPRWAWTARNASSPRPAGRRRCTCWARSPMCTGLVIGQDKVAKAGKANEITHFRPLLEPLPLAGVVITADAMQTQREHARWLTEDKDAFYLLPVLGNQPGTYAALDALDWENTPVAAATSEISRGRIETRTIRVLPAPDRPGLPVRQPGRPPGALRHDQEERPLDHA